MNAEFYAFGEILWDCLPSGRHAGGAPFNVAVHIAQLGHSAALISAVGVDPAGDEILQIARDKAIDTTFVTRVRSGLPTGTVLGTVDEKGNANYEVMQPAAWDEITLSAEALEALKTARAVSFGSLAARAPSNREELAKLLALDGPLKFFDVNLRPPFVDPQFVMAMAQQCDVVKLNDHEVGSLAAWIQSGEMKPAILRTMGDVAHACGVIAKATRVETICVSLAEQGAALWQNGEIVSVPAPKVLVKDTVGAGDAFMAGLMIGLTSRTDPKKVLQNACRVGACVASHNGATPALPQELKDLFKVSAQ